MSAHAYNISSPRSPIFEIADLVSEITGNQFTEKHRSMIENRLKRRCNELKIPSIDDYIGYFKQNKTEEIKHLISLLTTHHTFFFREFSHFEYLEEKALCDIFDHVRKRGDKKIKVWSAACSKGHEVYSLAMFLEITLQRLAPDLTYEILGTDIDPESVSFAKNGVYSRKEIKEIPLVYLSNHWAKGTGDIAEFVKAKNILQSKTRWAEMNLLSLPLNFTEKFDIIFCRNVFIYFSAKQIEESTKSLISHLNPHGYFFVGLSESLSGKELPINSVAPSIYRHLKVVPVPTSKDVTPTEKLTTPTPHTLRPVLKPALHKHEKPALTAKPAPPLDNLRISKEVLRVVCIDDSPSITTILKKVLSLDEGFEVVGTAINGLDAQAKIRDLKPDVVTLDIHMPEQNGIEYLSKNFNGQHPPVIMVSSVSREESDLALRALNLGASDYVEKPALSNITELGDELRRKLRSAYRNQVFYKAKSDLSLDQSFKKISAIKNPEKSIRFIFAQMSDKKRVDELLKEVGQSQPPTFILFDVKNVDPNHLVKGFSSPLKLLNEWPNLKTTPLKADMIFAGDALKLMSQLPSELKLLPSSILVFGELSARHADFFTNWKSTQILLEDLGPRRNPKNWLKAFASDTVPTTSFAYMSCEYLGRGT